MSSTNNTILKNPNEISNRDRHGLRYPKTSERRRQIRQKFVSSGSRTYNYYVHHHIYVYSSNTCIFVHSRKQCRVV